MFMTHIVSRLQGKIQLNLCAALSDPGGVVQEGNLEVPLLPPKNNRR